MSTHRHPHRPRQIIRHRIVQPHFAAGDHAGEDRRGEHFRDRADLEHVVDADTADADHPLLLVQQSDDDALAVLAGIW